MGDPHPRRLSPTAPTLQQGTPAMGLSAPLEGHGFHLREAVVAVHFILSVSWCRDN